MLASPLAIQAGPSIAKHLPAGIARRPDVDRGDLSNVVALWWRQSVALQPKPGPALKFHNKPQPPSSAAKGSYGAQNHRRQTPPALTLDYDYIEFEDYDVGIGASVPTSGANQAAFSIAHARQAFLGGLPSYCAWGCFA